MTELEETQNDKKAIIYMILAGCMAAGLGTISKTFSSTATPELLLIFARVFMVIGLIPLFIGLIAKKKIHELKTTPVNFIIHVSRSLIITFSLYFYFRALTDNDLVNVLAVFNTTPIFVGILGSLFLKEKLSKKGWFSVVLAFAGVLLIIKPTGDNLSHTLLLGFLAGFLMGVGEVLNKVLSNRKESDSSIIFWFMVLSFIFCFLPAYLNGVGLNSLPQDHKGPIDSDHWTMMCLGLGLFSFFYQKLRTSSISLAPASLVSPYSYSTLVVGGVVGWVKWGHSPGYIAILGMLLTVIAGVMLAKSEQKT